MSLVQLFKTDTEGFAFSDGALSTAEPRLLRSDVSKLVTVRHDLVVAAGGAAADSEQLKLKVAALPRSIPFRDALDFLRAEIGEHHRLYGTTAPGADSPHNLGVALLGLDKGKVRLLGWDAHSGAEQESPEWDNWSMGVSEPARIAAYALIYPAFEQYQQDRNRDAFIQSAEAAFKAAAQLEPQRIAGFYWAHMDSIGGNSAMDAQGNLNFKTKIEAAFSSGNTTSTSFADCPGLQLTATTKGNKVLVVFNALAYNSAANQGGLFQLLVDGTIQASAGIPGGAANARSNATASRMLSLSETSHTFNVQWEVYPSSGTLYGVQGYLQVVELG